MLKIRFANKTDIKRVFDLSNDKTVRQNSINQEEILWENHVKWFENRINNIGEPFYIVENENNNFVAQVRFDKKEDKFFISISIHSDFRGKGLASSIIKECSGKTEIKEIYSLVKEDNVASQKAFLKSDYKLISSKDGIKTFVFENG